MAFSDLKTALKHGSALKKWVSNFKIQRKSTCGKYTFQICSLNSDARIFFLLYSYNKYA
jgi:hypothetical protein